ncbi:MAG TPA: hypothetical protein VLX68_06795 [Chitinivibrionales bacterium]|nr:hypothetical protein [Chitinivibrionales bacterium]
MAKGKMRLAAVLRSREISGEKSHVMARRNKLMDFYFAHGAAAAAARVVNIVVAIHVN